MAAEPALPQVREQLLEALRLTASAERQLAYQRAVPIAQVPAEVLYLWPEWIADDPGALAALRPAERAAVTTFHAEWRAVWEQPESYVGRHAEDVLGTTGWTRLMAAAAAALAAFEAR